MTDEQYAEDLRVMIEADTNHLAEAIEEGRTQIAKGFVESLIANKQELRRIKKRLERLNSN